jgi:predicted Zn-dependent peptidase
MQFCITGESSRIELACDIITKLFEPLSDALSTGEFELERGRIRAEIREYDEKSSLDYLVKKNVWNGTELSGMITGTLGSVSKITLPKCERERKEIFSSGNFFFYVTGNYPDDAIQYIAEKTEKYIFEKFPERGNSCTLPADFRSRNGNVLMKDSGYYMVEMCFDMDTARFSKPQRALFYDMMFAGENCRFFKELSENLGYIYSYDAKIEEYQNAGNLSISFEVEYKRLYDSLEACVSLFRKMKEDATGLSRAKVYYTDNACLVLDNAEELNWNMAYENHILDEKVKSIEDRKNFYASVTEAQIMKLACDVFRFPHLVMGIKGRKKKIDTEKVTEIMKKLDF